jgi:uncharacterized membrane protein YkoI
MNPTRRSFAARGAALALTLGGLAAAGASGGVDDADDQATGPGAARARHAALARFPGGRVTSVERETDGGAAWEVEVTGPDGPPVDVALDRAYRIVGADPDDDSEDPE